MAIGIRRLERQLMLHRAKHRWKNGNLVDAPVQFGRKFAPARKAMIGSARFNVALLSVGYDKLLCVSCIRRH